jgi:hypothetical protein
MRAAPDIVNDDQAPFVAEHLSKLLGGLFHVQKVAIVAGQGPMETTQLTA